VAAAARALAAASQSASYARLAAAAEQPSAAALSAAADAATAAAAPDDYDAPASLPKACASPSLFCMPFPADDQFGLLDGGGGGDGSAFYLPGCLAGGSDAAALLFAPDSHLMFDSGAFF
jgi:hypothetical protein